MGTWRWSQADAASLSALPLAPTFCRSSAQGPMGAAQPWGRDNSCAARTCVITSVSTNRRPEGLLVLNTYSLILLLKDFYKNLIS